LPSPPRPVWRNHAQDVKYPSFSKGFLWQYIAEIGCAGPQAHDDFLQSCSILDSTLFPLGVIMTSNQT
jgi:hypothetical protein